MDPLEQYRAEQLAKFEQLRSLGGRFCVYSSSFVEGRDPDSGRSGHSMPTDMVWVTVKAGGEVESVSWSRYSVLPDLNFFLHTTMYERERGKVDVICGKGGVELIRRVPLSTLGMPTEAGGLRDALIQQLGASQDEISISLES